MMINTNRKENLMMGKQTRLNRLHTDNHCVVQKKRRVKEREKKRKKKKVNHAKIANHLTSGFIFFFSLSRYCHCAIMSSSKKDKQGSFLNPFFVYFNLIQLHTCRKRNCLRIELYH